MNLLLKNDTGDKHEQGNQFQAKQTTEKRARACHDPGQSGNESCTCTYVCEQHKN